MINQVVSSLEQTGVLEGKPKLELVERHYQKVMQQIPGITFDQVQEQTISAISSVQEPLVVDCGSGYGVRGGGYIGSRVTSSEVLLIDKPMSRTKIPPWIFNSGKRYEHELRFAQGENLIGQYATDDLINRLYQMNSLPNVKFVGKTLVTNQSLSILGSDLGDREIFLSSFRSPYGLPFIVGDIYNKSDASSLWVSFNPGKIGQSVTSWEIIIDSLELTPAQASGFKASLYYWPKAAESIKHANEIGPLQQFGGLVNLAFSLPLANQIQGEVFLNKDLLNTEFNRDRIDFYVHAER